MKRQLTMAFFVAVCSQFLSMSPAFGADSGTVPGWTVSEVTVSNSPIKSCVATWTKSEPTGLAILAEGPLLTLVVSSPAFEHAKKEDVVSLKTKRLGVMQRQAVVLSSSYGITTDSDVDAYLLDEGPLTLTIMNVDYSFTLANTSSAIDMVRRCVGQPTRADMEAKTAPSFPVPKGWEPLDVGSGCAVRLQGKQVDTILSLNNDDKVLLIAGRREWNSAGEQIAITVQFDSQPAGSYTGWKWNNLVLLLLVDDKDVAALRKASAIRWHLPSGDYTAEVHDVGSALDSASACKKQKGTSTGH